MYTKKVKRKTKARIKNVYTKKISKRLLKCIYICIFASVDFLYKRIRLINRHYERNCIGRW